MHTKLGCFLRPLCIDSVLHRNRSYTGKFHTVKEISHLQIKTQHFIILKELRGLRKQPYLLI